MLKTESQYLLLDFIQASIQEYLVRYTDNLLSILEKEEKDLLIDCMSFGVRNIDTGIIHSGFVGSRLQ